MLIFSYGSNMNISRLRSRVPSAVKISNAYLKGYQMKCNKISIDKSSKGNIIPTENENDRVWGVVFNIEDKQKKDLDRVEGLGKGYYEMMIFCTDINNNNYNAQVYIAKQEFISDDLIPYDWYKELILTGAKENSLPTEYVEQLEAMAFNVDTDSKRREANLSK